jgi:hypothetical protein
LFLAAFLAGLLGGASGLAEDTGPVARWIPSQAVLVFEIAKPNTFLQPLLSTAMAEAVTSLPAYQAQKDNRKFKEFCGLVTLLEGQLQTDWRTGLRQLVGDGLTFALGPRGEILLCADSQDPKMWQKLHETFLGFAKADAEKANQPDRVTSREYRGVTGWTFGPEETHVILNHRLLMSNRPEVLRYVLDLRAEPDGSSVAALPAYQAAKEALGPNTVATAYLNIEALREHPGLKQALERNPNPLAALLFAEVRHVLQQAHWLGLGFYVKDDRLTLKAVTDQPASGQDGAERFAQPPRPEDGALPNLSVPRSIAGLSLYRDLHGFYAAKDTLFPERTSGLIFFENMMGIFFSGLDLTEEVLGQTKSEIRLVAARQEYDPAIGTPALPLPAFAAVFRLREPDKFGAVVEEAWQKAIGLVNFTRGQKALPGLILDKFTHDQSQGTVAYYRPPDQTNKTDLHLRYNFRPALARIGEYLVLSSTDGLARDLIDALRAELAAGPKPSPSTHSFLELDGVSLRDILTANRPNLIRKNMVDKGNSHEKAESEIDLLLTLLGCFRQVKLGLGQEAGRPALHLELNLCLPKPTQAANAASNSAASTRGIASATAQAQP